MQAPYIPAKDADFALWLANFAGLIAATPTDYGLVAGDATVISAANAAFQAAYTAATTPETRTSATIAQKDAQRAAAEATVRPYAVQISRNAAVSDELKLGVGVNLPNPGRTPVPPPATAPALQLVSATPGVHTLRYTDSTTPASKAKPPGVIGLELYRAIGTVPAVDPTQADYVNTLTKSPQNVETSAGDVGKTATYFARWTTRSGPAGAAQKGPWSAPLVVAVI